MQYQLCSPSLIKKIIKWYDMNQHSAITVAGTVPEFHGFPLHKRILYYFKLRTKKNCINTKTAYFSIFMQINFLYAQRKKKMVHN